MIDGIRIAYNRKVASTAYPDTRREKKSDGRTFYASFAFSDQRYNDTGTLVYKHAQAIRGKKNEDTRRIRVVLPFERVHAVYRNEYEGQ